MLQVCQDEACLCFRIKTGVSERSALVCGDSLWQLSWTDCHHMCTEAVVAKACPSSSQTSGRTGFP